MSSGVAIHRFLSAGTNGVLGLLLVAPCIASAQESKTITFEAPGAGTGAGQGTFVSGVNAAGTIAGNYIDANNVSHSFLRNRNGVFTTFDPPGTASIYYPGFEGSGAIGLNDAGAAGGYFVDATFTVHAYIRTPDGRFITYDWPGACTASQNTGCHGSGVWNINDFGVAVGPYEDTSGNFVAHCAIRYPDGRFTTFEVPGSAMLVGEGTLPASFSGLNRWGAITGEYYDSNYVFHSFLRTAEGKFIKFEAPGADTTDSFYGTFPTSLNDSTQIAGYYLDSNGVYHGFQRNPDGTFKVVDAPGQGTVVGSFTGSFPQAINNAGGIIGYFSDANGVNHGFLRKADMSFLTFDAPGADVIDAGAGTIAVGLNNADVIAGYYYDSSFVSHGFVRIEDE